MSSKNHEELGDGWFWLSGEYAPKFFAAFEAKGWALDLGDMTGNLYSPKGRRLFYVQRSIVNQDINIQRLFDPVTSEPFPAAIICPEWAVGGSNRRKKGSGYRKASR